VLSRALKAAGLEWDTAQAHSAVYDTERTAQLFCKIVNDLPMLNAASPVQAQAEPDESDPHLV